MAGKIITLPDLLIALTPLRKVKKRIVLATGVFDLFHRAHSKFLKCAKQAGDILVVGIESDERVKRLKGLQRPVDTISVRLQNVASLTYVDWVFALPQAFDTPQDYNNLIASLQPNVLAVSDHTPFIEYKQQILRKNGGEVKIVMKQDPTISTTALLHETSIKR